jgi:hypothetical protein
MFATCGRDSPIQASLVSRALEIGSLMPSVVAQSHRFRRPRFGTARLLGCRISSPKNLTALNCRCELAVRNVSGLFALTFNRQLLRPRMHFQMSTRISGQSITHCRCSGAWPERQNWHESARRSAAARCSLANFAFGPRLGGRPQDKEVER